MSAPRRIRVKVFADDSSTMDLPSIIPVFHHWIQEHRVPGLLIDVASYPHVYQGPGVLLIGHEADYVLDMGDGRPGLVYDHKRQDSQDASAPTLAERLRAGFLAALTGCRELEAEPSLQPSIRFRPDRAEISFVDRLRTPNQSEVWERLEPDVRAVLDIVYGPAGYTLERASTDPRHALTVRANAESSPDLNTLLNRLENL